MWERTSVIGPATQGRQFSTHPLHKRAKSSFSMVKRPIWIQFCVGKDEEGSISPDGSPTGDVHRGWEVGLSHAASVSPTENIITVAKPMLMEDCSSASQGYCQPDLHYEHNSLLQDKFLDCGHLQPGPMCLVGRAPKVVLLPQERSNQNRERPQLEMIQQETNWMIRFRSGRETNT